MGRLRRIACYSMIPVIIICIIASNIYYEGMGLNDYERLLCSLDNTVKMFLARPTIQPVLALKSINDQYTKFEEISTYAYSFLVIVAPILMTTAIVAGFSAYLFDFFNSIKLSFKDKMYIVGDGDTAKKVASKYARKFRVFYLMPSITTNEERVPLLKEKINAFNVNYKNITKECKSIGIEKASYIVICFKDWVDSYKTVTDLVEYLIQKDLKEPIPVYIIDAPSVFRTVFETMYLGFCKKYEKSDTMLTFSYIRVHDMNANQFFRNPQLTTQPDNKHHIIFTGLGGYGRAFIKGLIAYMMDNKLTGTVEILDKNLEPNLHSLIYSGESIEEYASFETIDTVKNAKLSVRCHTPAGNIDCNFYRVRIGDLDATNFLAEMLKTGAFTEYFCCIEDVATCFETYRMIESSREVFDNANIYFRVAPVLMNTFEALQAKLHNLMFLPDSFPDIELITENTQPKGK